MTSSLLKEAANNLLLMDKLKHSFPFDYKKYQQIVDLTAWFFCYEMTPNSGDNNTFVYDDNGSIILNTDIDGMETSHTKKFLMDMEKYKEDSRCILNEAKKFLMDMEKYQEDSRCILNEAKKFLMDMEKYQEDSRCILNEAKKNLLKLEDLRQEIPDIEKYYKISAHTVWFLANGMTPQLNKPNTCLVGVGGHVVLRSTLIVVGTDNTDKFFTWLERKY